MTKTFTTTGWVVASLAALAIGFISIPVFAQTLDCGCALHTETIQSDDTNTIVGDGNAVAVATSSAWTASIPGATWIWNSGALPPNETVAFEKTFTVVGTVLSATLDIASDNSYQVFIDGVPVAADASAVNFTLATQDAHDLTASVTPGVHTLRIEVTNISGPAGLLYRFVIESEDCPPAHSSGISITICNRGTIVNETEADASTGGNWAGGSYGGNGGNAGDVEAYGGGNFSNGGASTGNGGNGGNAGPGGLVNTGNASATAVSENDANGTEVELDADGDMNSSLITILINNLRGGACDREGCPPSNTIENSTKARARTGGNYADGSYGGDGGDAGDVEPGDGSYQNGGAETGSGGNGGDGGIGGTINSGNAEATSAALNILNRVIVRILRLNSQ
jgi:hypothetical protein